MNLLEITKHSSAFLKSLNNRKEKNGPDKKIFACDLGIRVERVPVENAAMLFGVEPELIKGAFWDGDGIPLLNNLDEMKFTACYEDCYQVVIANHDPKVKTKQYEDRASKVDKFTAKAEVGFELTLEFKISITDPNKQFYDIAKKLLQDDVPLTLVPIRDKFPKENGKLDLN
jgi:hypothetical protein